MRLLTQERAQLSRFLPNLDEQLAQTDFMLLESSQSPAIEWYREAGGPGLLISQDHGGSGADALAAVQLTRALAARAPSLALATTMHQFSVASLLCLAGNSEGPEWMLLDAVARDRRLMASAFAEGRAGQSILAPTMTAKWDGKNWLISGRKQPCSLSRSMDLLTASVLLEYPDKPSEPAVALISAQSKGLTRSPFWTSPILAGAESDAVILDSVVVHPDLVFPFDTHVDGALDELQTVGFVWFELLLSACYLGVCANLVERVLLSARGPLSERVALITAIESANMLLDGMARELQVGQPNNDFLAYALIQRYAITDTISKTATKAVELLGGMAFITAPDVAYLYAACAAINFHPPSRHSTNQALHDWYSDKPLVIE